MNNIIWIFILCLFLSCTQKNYKEQNVALPASNFQFIVENQEKAIAIANSTYMFFKDTLEVDEFILFFIRSGGDCASCVAQVENQLNHAIYKQNIPNTFQVDLLHQEVTDVSKDTVYAKEFFSPDQWKSLGHISSPSLYYFSGNSFRAVYMAKTEARLDSLATNHFLQKISLISK